MQTDIDNEYMHKANSLASQNVEKNRLIQLGHLMPWLVPVLTFIMIGQTILMRILHKLITTIEEMPRFWFLHRIEQVFLTRTLSSEKVEQKRRVDLLQLMLDVATTNQVKDHLDSGLMSKELHYDEVKYNAFLFLVGGYGPTTSALSYCTYVLATKLEIQKKLQEEIDDYEEKDDESEYDRVHNMVYLDLFIREVLRMHPIAPQAISRECDAMTTICGHTIDKGCVIQPDLYTIHYDPSLWGPEDPNLFVPERHTTERHPMAYMPFSLGPRSCIGMRFALMEIKLCLTRLLRQYSILSGDKMEENFKLHDMNFNIHPEALYVKIEKRS